MGKDDVKHEKHQDTHVHDLSDIMDPFFIRQSADENNKKHEEKGCQHLSVELERVKC